MESEIVRESEVLEIVNEILKTNYWLLSEVTDRQLWRVYHILAIQKILADNPGFQLFSCKSEQIKEGPIGMISDIKRFFRK